jgi:putative hydrolase of the HAD superfamily
VAASLTSIKAVSFDLDDTLWACAPAIANAEAALYRWHQQVTPAIVESLSPASLQGFRTAFREANPALHGCVSAMRLAGLRALLNEFGYAESLAEEAFAVFYRARSEVQLYPGVIDMLDALKCRFRLAAITNGNADLELIGISSYFDVVYAADLDLRPKPQPDMFERCLMDMDLPAQGLLHIGDNPVADIGGGHNARVQTLWFNPYNECWPEYLPPPHFQAQALSEIVSLLS